MQGDTLSPQLMLSAHSASIHDVTFPHNCSGIVATCGFEAISLWDVHTSTKLLSIRLPGLTCHALAVAEVVHAHPCFGAITLSTAVHGSSYVMPIVAGW